MPDACPKLALVAGEELDHVERPVAGGRHAGPGGKRGEQIEIPVRRVDDERPRPRTELQLSGQVRGHRLSSGG
jgi:hypothetical protein